MKAKICILVFINFIYETYLCNDQLSSSGCIVYLG